MNGATTDPLVNTSNPPSSSITIIIGASQYFLRARMKAKSSTMNDKASSVQAFGRMAPRRDHFSQRPRFPSRISIFGAA
jgi:hypothetical protein